MELFLARLMILVVVLIVFASVGLCLVALCNGIDQAEDDIDTEAEEAQ